MLKRALLLGALAIAMAPTAHAGKVVTGANSRMTQMDAEKVRRIFLGRDGGATAQHYIYQKGGPTKAEFDKKVLGKSGSELSTYWSKLVFTGKAKAPGEAANDAEVKAKVSSNPALIGYISDSAVDSSVKVLFDF